MDRAFPLWFCSFSKMIKVVKWSPKNRVRRIQNNIPSLPSLKNNSRELSWLQLSKIRLNNNTFQSTGCVKLKSPPLAPVLLCSTLGERRATDRSMCDADREQEIVQGQRFEVCPGWTSWIIWLCDFEGYLYCPGIKRQSIENYIMSWYNVSIIFYCFII